MEQKMSDKVLRMRRIEGEIQVCVSDMWPSFRGVLRDALTLKSVTELTQKLQRERGMNTRIWLHASDHRTLWAHEDVARHIINEIASDEYKQWLDECITKMKMSEEVTGQQVDAMEFPVPVLFLATYSGPTKEGIKGRVITDGEGINIGHYMSHEDRKEA